MSKIAIQRTVEPGLQAQEVKGVFEEFERRTAEIRERAYELFMKRGGELGHALEDWLEAEQEILGGPKAELAEDDRGFDLGMSLPGFDPEQVEVTVTPKEIIVHAVKKDAKAGEVCEEVFRWVELPVTIDVDHAAARLDEGILHVTAEKCVEG